VLDVISERDLSEFDKNLLLTAYNDFRVLTQRFPDSKYVTDARKRMVFLRNQLARSDLAIANFYASREAWVAVTNRTKFILQNYQGSSVIKSTLKLQLRAYQALELDELANDTQRIIDLNYSQGS
jgi:outer membrane protein assembly factor BamD